MDRVVEQVVSFGAFGRAVSQKVNCSICCLLSVCLISKLCCCLAGAGRVGFVTGQQVARAWGFFRAAVTF